MAAFIPVPNTAEVRMGYTSGTEICENTYHVLGSAPWDAPGLTALLNIFTTWEAGTAKVQRGTDVEHISEYAFDMTEQFGPSVTLGAAIIGTAAGANLPNNVTFSVKCSSGLRGRVHRGRTYWIGLTQSQLDPVANGQKVTNAVSTAIVAALNNLQTSINLSGINGAQMVIVSRHLNGSPRAVGITTPILNWAAVDNTVDAQRRRLPGHNRHR